MFIDLFPVRIYKNRIESASTLLESIYPLLDSQWSRETNHPHTGTLAESSYLVDNKLHQQPELKPLVDELQAHVQAYWAELNYYQGLKPFIAEMYPIAHLANIQT